MAFMLYFLQEKQLASSFAEKKSLICRFVKHMLHHQVRNHLKQFEEISILAGA